MAKQFLLSILLIFGFAASNGQGQELITATIPYQGVLASGEYEICRSYFTSVSIANARKLVIFVEGIDANNERNISQLKAVIYQNSPGSLSLGQKLNMAGYDILILNFKEGGDYIQRNAFVLAELIKQVNLQKTTPEPLVVVGYSMGGLVARYALAYMEAHGLPHDTRLYVSFDSPHKGAHIPVSVQALALNFSGPLILSMFPQLAESLNQFKAPAAQQMLRYVIPSATTTSGIIPVNVKHIAFMNEMKGLNDCNGFPTQTRNIAISLGSWNGIPQRTNLDVNGDGEKDYQFGGILTMSLNMTGIAGGMITHASPCEIAAITSFQAWLANSGCTDYPYASTRGAFTGITNPAEMEATFFYHNGGIGLGMLLPSGSWSRGWAYKDGDNPMEPTDFEPGSFTPLYRTLTEAINTDELKCAFRIADNATFVPTVSALCFDTNDPFYNIGADPDRLKKTPFEAIIGVDGDNRSHESDQAVHNDINDWLLDQITGGYTKSCTNDIRELNSVVATGSNVTVNDAGIIKTIGYYVQADATVHLVAPQYIELQSVSDIGYGSRLIAEIGHCSPKPCGYAPEHPLYKGTGVTDSVFYTSNIGEPGISVALNKPLYIRIYPNPATNTIHLIADTKVAFKEVGVYDVMGRKLLSKSSGAIDQKGVVLDVSGLAEGNYLLLIADEKGKTETHMFSKR